jgi:hypothetical protein
MDSEPNQKLRNTKLKIATDVFSAISVFFMIVGLPIWAHYIDAGRNLERGAGTPRTAEEKLFIISICLNLIPAAFGGIWLLYRYRPLRFMETRLMNDIRYRVLVSFSIPLLYYVGYLILKITLWR